MSTKVDLPLAPDRVTIEWFCEERVVCFTIPDDSRATIDKWYEHVAQVHLDWPIDKPYFVIHDIAGPGVTLTPYARARAEAAMKLLPPDLSGRIAVVLDRTLGSQIMQLFSRMFSRPDLVLQVFFSREAALAWIKQGFGDSGPG